MLRRVAAFCRPLRPVLLLVSFPRSRSPAVWRVGAVLDVAWCAVCVSAVPNSWRIEDPPPPGKLPPFLGCCTCAQAAGIERKLARQWPNRPQVPFRRRRWDTKMPVDQPRTDAKRWRGGGTQEPPPPPPGMGHRCVCVTGTVRHKAEGQRKN